MNKNNDRYRKHTRQTGKTCNVTQTTQNSSSGGSHAGGRPQPCHTRPPQQTRRGKKTEAAATKKFPPQTRGTTAAAAAAAHRIHSRYTQHSRFTQHTVWVTAHPPHTPRHELSSSQGTADPRERTPNYLNFDSNKTPVTESAEHPIIKVPTGSIPSLTPGEESRMREEKVKRTTDISHQQEVPVVHILRITPNARAM